MVVKSYVAVPELVTLYTTACVECMRHSQTILKLLMTGRDHPRGGIMIPIPQYPLYTATIAEFNAYGVSCCILVFADGLCGQPDF